MKQKIEAVFFEQTCGYIQMPYLEGGTMCNWLFGSEKPDKNPKCLRNENEIQSTLQQILQGIQFIHKNNIIHRDLKVF